MVAHDQTDALKHAVPVLVETKKKAKSVVSIKPLTSDVNTDHSAVFMNAGGPVWALDTCGKKGEATFIALSAHPTEKTQLGELVAPNHQYSEKYQGSNLIQIWSAPAKATQRATLVHTILHQGGLAWSLKWAPLASSYTRAPGIGLLAATLADGHLMLYRVDLTSYSIVGSYLDQASTFLSVSWSLTHPYLLLTGSVNGVITMWNVQDAVDATESKTLIPQRRFEDADACSKQPEHHWGSGWVAVRDISWSPHDPYLFCSIGNDTILRIWDLREPRACLRAHRALNFTFGLQVLWFNPTTILIASDQGSVFSIDPLNGMQRILVTHPHVDSPVWSFTTTETSDGPPALITACASGVLFQTRLDRLNAKRMQPVSWLQIKTVEPATSFMFDHFVYKHTISAGKRTFPPRAAAIYRTQFTPHGDKLVWAGHNGLVGIMPFKFSVARASDKPIGRPRIHDINSRQGKRKRALKNSSLDEEDDDEDEEPEDDEETTESSGESISGEDDDNVEDDIRGEHLARRKAPARIPRRAKAGVEYVEVSEDDAATTKSKTKSTKDAPKPAVKRGRPPKKSLQVLEIEKKSATKKPKPSSSGVKRGRPGKKATTSNSRLEVKQEQIEASTDEVRPPVKRGKAKKKSTEPAQTNQELSNQSGQDGNEAAPPVEKIRGRPKKVVSIKEEPQRLSQEEQQPSNQVQPKRGRPKKVSASSEPKRGRPKKVPSSGAASAKTTTTPVSRENPKAKRGRPPKISTPKEAVTIVIDDDSDELSNEASQQAKPRSVPQSETVELRVKSEPQICEAPTTTPKEQEPLRPGQVVEVAKRTGAGMNKLGGTGWIKCINSNGTVDVKYVLGGQERQIPLEFVVAADESSRKRRRV
ncbi:hypothetical protein LEN26_019179 [Aphanomyces euteiches]|nr:hypothetical protein LEN26_019179 [Aphanomyces euteiches]KAH9101593.1 hypothetical protein AeMF1_021683 [Aphanomyces euteiches]KAH9189152.1 hypothetical protein AeNC1_008876 [Aphanomyces euteiches]